MEKDSKKEVGSIFFLVLLVMQAVVCSVQAETNNEPQVSSTLSNQKAQNPVVGISDESGIGLPRSGDENEQSGVLLEVEDDETGGGFGFISHDSTTFINTQMSQEKIKNRFQEFLLKLYLLIYSIKTALTPKDGYSNPEKTPDDPTSNHPWANVTDEPVNGTHEPQLSTRDCEEPLPSAYEYPRLSLGTQWLQDWLDEPGYGLQWLYQFQNIYTVTITEELWHVQQAAYADGHGDWVRNTKFICMDCFCDARDYTSVPFGWEYYYAPSSPNKAIDIAIYENKLLGCDWFMRDIEGNKIWLWAEGISWAIDTSPNCPRGLWDGNYTYEGHQYCLGDTRGLTFAEWFTGPFKEHVIEHSLFASVYDGIQSEDYLTAWLYTFRGQIPDPERDGTGMNYNELTDYCRDTWNLMTTNFWGDLARQGFITRLNGNGLKWRGEGYTNDWPAWQESFAGCKFEDCFKWGGWPRYNIPMYWNCYRWVEELYHPMSQNPNENDNLQGWDVTSIQVNAEKDWPEETRLQFKRFGLAFTLMGDGVADCYANAEDYFFGDFLRGLGGNPADPTDAPEGIPEMNFPLGYALDSYQTYSYYPLNPLYYRQFYNNDTQQMYTVAVNIWNFAIQNIPAQDGVWFTGDWPDGVYEHIIFE